MEKTWLLNYGHRVGLSHLPNNVPCQDRALCVSKNGVTVAVLSDGCGSSAISEHGAELITSKLCEFFTENFDSLIPEDDDDVIKTRRRILEHIGETHREFINQNMEMFEVLKITQAEKYAKFANGTAQRDWSFYFDCLNATLLFVAIKGEQGIVGQVGDGMIVGLQDNKIRILLEEDKNEAVNGTYYPIKLYDSGTRNEKYFAASNLFTLRFPKIGSFDGFALMSDGVDGLIDKRILGEKKMAPALGNHMRSVMDKNDFEASQQDTQDLLERLCKVSTAKDDCSLAFLINKDGVLDDPEYVVKEIVMTQLDSAADTSLYIDNAGDQTNEEDGGAALDSPWLLNHGCATGKVNEIKGIICQNDVVALSEGGIGIAVLSDANPASILSAQAAEIACDKVSIFLRNNFDDLVENNTQTNKESKARILKVITDAYNQFIEHNIEKFEELKKDNPKMYKDFCAGKVVAFEENEFYHEFLQATLTFVACKEDKTIVGNVGDGMVIGVVDNKFKMIANGTNIPEVFYPTDVYRREVYEHFTYQVFTSKIDGYVVLPKALGVASAKLLPKLAAQLTLLSTKKGNFECNRGFAALMKQLVVDAKGKDANIAIILKRASKVRMVKN